MYLTFVCRNTFSSKHIEILPHTSPESAAFTLRQCLSREVQEKVSLVDDDVDQMLQKLEEEYGDPSLMTDLIVSEIKSYEVQGKKERLMKFIDIVEKGYYDLNNLGLDRELSNTIVVGIIETKLPEGTRQKWVDRVCSDDSKREVHERRHEKQVPKPAQVPARSQKVAEVHVDGAARTTEGVHTEHVSPVAIHTFHRKQIHHQRPEL